MSLATTIQRIDDLKKELDALKPIKPEYEQRIRRKFRLDWTYHSNSIEGNSLTYGETEKLILFDQYAPDKPGRDNREVEGHGKLLKELESTSDLQGVFTEHTIREFHKQILGDEPYYSPALTSDNTKTSRLITPGRYKQDSNNVQTVTGEIFEFTSPLNTPAEMQKLIQWTNEELKTKKNHPLIFAAGLHYQFIRIHPFDDGNGRMARILMNIALQIHYFPPVIVKVTDKERYYSALRDADVGNLDSFIDYIGNLLVESLELAIRGAKGERIDEEDDIDKEIELTRLKLLKARETEAKKQHDEKQSAIQKRLLVLKSFMPLVINLDKKLSHLKNDFSAGRTLVELSTVNLKTESDVGTYSWNEANQNQFASQFSKISTHLDALEAVPGTLFYGCEFTGDSKLLKKSKSFKIWLKLTFGKDTYTVISAVNGNNLPVSITKSPDENLKKDEINDYVTNIMRSFLDELEG